MGFYPYLRWYFSLLEKYRSKGQEMILAQLVFIALNILLAYIDSRKIAAGIRIKHGWNGAFYAVFILIAFFVTGQQWPLIPLLLLIRKSVFDITLNLFRGLDWDYVSHSTTSIIDQLYRKVMGWDASTWHLFNWFWILFFNALTYANH